jgi:hypothetical protein
MKVNPFSFFLKLHIVLLAVSLFYTTQIHPEGTKEIQPTSTYL